MIAGNSNNFQTGRGRGRGRSRGGRGCGLQNYVTGGRGTGGGYIRNHHYYCWTHGACGHDGTRCRHPSVGHQKNATFQNRMNGNPAYCQQTQNQMNIQGSQQNGQPFFHQQHPQ